MASSRTIHHSNDGSSTINIMCPFCHKKSTVTVPTAGYCKWINGDLIQNAMPNSCADVREVLITGICPKCWDKTFPPEDGK